MSNTIFNKKVWTFLCCPKIDFGKVEQEVSLKLYSADGKLIQSKTQIQDSLYQLKLPKTTGIYILEIKTTKGISHYKIIKE